MKSSRSRRVNPRFRDLYRLRDLYGPNFFQTVGNSIAVNSDDILRTSCLNPRLGHPLSLLEMWDGALLLKQEHYVRLDEDDVEALEAVYLGLQTQPDQDFQTEIGQLHLVYQAREKYIFFKGENTQIAFGMASVAILGRLIDALKHRLPFPGDDNEGESA